MIVFNDFQRTWADVGADAQAAFARVGASGWYVLGREVEAFEAELAEFWGMRHAVGVANGLDAIEIGLRAAGLQAGDRVLTTPMSAFATTLAVLRAGGVPVFVDVDSDGALDLDAADAALAAERAAGRPIRFLVPVHLYGRSMDLERLAGLVARHELELVEDCAQSIGAWRDGRAAGSVGRAAACSFYPTKNLGALGDGGALLTDDDDLAELARSLRNYGQERRFEHVRLGMNSRLDEVHAAVLRDSFLPRLHDWTARRAEIADHYRSELRSVRVPSAAEPGSHVWHLFRVEVDPAEREGFLEHLRAQEVQCGVHYPHLIPDQTALAGHDFEVLGPLPNARRVATASVSLPIHPYLTDDEVSRVVEACNAWNGER